MARLENNPNNCTVALHQTDDIFESMIRYTYKTLCAVLNAYPVFLLEGVVRCKLNDILNQNRL